MTATNYSSNCSCKVGRKITKYGLNDLDTELIRRRQDVDASLRELAAYINQRILAAALSEIDAEITAAVYGAVSDDDALTVLYETLADDDVPADREARVRTRLTQLGVDVEAVEADWVTHPTVRKHLRQCCNVETSRNASITLDDARDTIEWARTRCARVVNRTFERLQDANLVRTGNREVTVIIQITCTACRNTYRPTQLLDKSACACYQNTAERDPET